MAEMRAAFKCCAYTMSKSKSKPILLALAILFAIYFEGKLAPLRSFLMETGTLINAWGLFAYVLSDIEIIFVFGIGVLVLFGDAPFFDQAQQFVLMRSGQRSWILGQLLYILIFSFLYLLAIFLLQCLFLLPYIETSNAWGRAITSIARTDIGEKYMLLMRFPSTILQKYTPLSAFATSFALRWIFWCTCALLMMGINLLSRTKSGALFALALILFDYMMDGFAPPRHFIYSPSTMARLSILSKANDPNYPDALSGIFVVCGSFLVSMIFVSVVGAKVDVANLAKRS